MSVAPSLAPARPLVRARSRFLGSVYAGTSSAVLGRGFLATKSNNWIVVLSGFFEPVFYLLSLGLGLGALVGDVTTSSGEPVSYAAYIAPGLLAVSAMNGAIYDSTWNVFFKMQFAKLYEGMLATSLGPLDVALGEISLALLRGALYAVGFMAIMQALGLNLSWTAILFFPLLIRAACLTALPFSMLAIFHYHQRDAATRSAFRCHRYPR